MKCVVFFHWIIANNRKKYCLSQSYNQKKWQRIEWNMEVTDHKHDSLVVVWTVAVEHLCSLPLYHLGKIAIKLLTWFCSFFCSTCKQFYFYLDVDDRTYFTQICICAIDSRNWNKCFLFLFFSFALSGIFQRDARDFFYFCLSLISKIVTILLLLQFFTRYASCHSIFFNSFVVQ